jgi:hypothetical protein
MQNLMFLDGIASLAESVGRLFGQRHAMVPSDQVVHIGYLSPGTFGGQVLQNIHHLQDCPP